MIIPLRRCRGRSDRRSRRYCRGWRYRRGSSCYRRRGSRRISVPTVSVTTVTAATTLLTGIYRRRCCCRRRLAASVFISISISVSAFCFFCRCRSHCRCQARCCCRGCCCLRRRCCRCLQFFSTHTDLFRIPSGLFAYLCKQVLMSRLQKEQDHFRIDHIFRCIRQIKLNCFLRIFIFHQIYINNLSGSHRSRFFHTGKRIDTGDLHLTGGQQDAILTVFLHVNITGGTPDTHDHRRGTYLEGFIILQFFIHFKKEGPFLQIQIQFLSILNEFGRAQLLQRHGLVIVQTDGSQTLRFCGKHITAVQLQIVHDIFLYTAGFQGNGSLDPQQTHRGSCDLLIFSKQQNNNDRRNDHDRRCHSTYDQSFLFTHTASKKTCKKSFRFYNSNTSPAFAKEAL